MIMYVANRYHNKVSHVKSQKGELLPHTALIDVHVFVGYRLDYDQQGHLAVAVPRPVAVPSVPTLAGPEAPYVHLGILSTRST